MNVVFMMSDTLRADHLSCYGNDWIHTPNIEAFAERSAVFDKAYTASFATIPNRTDLMTGRYGEPLHPWLPLHWDALTYVEILRENGFVTQLINDTPHLINAGHGFDRPFHAWLMIRGNEVDRFRMDSLPVDFPTKDLSKIIARPANRSDAQYLRNVRYRRTEEDYFSAQLYGTACEWLEMNRGHENFFLWIDGFDPHEPWDPPQHYLDLYETDYDGDVFLQHIRVPPEAMTEAEMSHLKATYAASVTLVDRWWGELFKTLERLGMMDDTAVIVTADHGTYLCEHGKVMGKSPPLYDQAARVPLLIRLPDGTGAGKRFNALAQAPDIMPTILDLAGLPIPDTVQGKSLLPVLRGEAEDIRELAFSGTAPNATADQALITVRDGRWMLHDFTDRDRWELYDGENDPAQECNVIEEHPQEADRLHGGLLEFLKTHDAPPQIVRWFETGDKGDMTGYRYRPPGYENFETYWNWILDSKIVPE